MSKQNEIWISKIRADKDHREFVGPTYEYDLNAAMQFNLLTYLGLHEGHTLLDIGCGSLRAGRLFIVYLRPGHYFGIEPEKWLVESAIRKEIGKDLVRLKSPRFSHNRDFSCEVFNQKFDFILAQGIFVHAPEWQIRRCMQESAKCMNTDTIFAATYMQGDENYVGKDWLYPQTSSYTPSRVVEMASSAGLSCVGIDWPHPRGAKWIILYNSEIENKIMNLVRRTAESNPDQTSDMLRKRLSKSNSELSRLMEHPYVRIGLRIKRMVNQVLSFIR